MRIGIIPPKPEEFVGKLTKGAPAAFFADFGRPTIDLLFGGFPEADIFLLDAQSHLMYAARSAQVLCNWSHHGWSHYRDSRGIGLGIIFVCGVMIKGNSSRRARENRQRDYIQAAAWSGGGSLFRWGCPLG